MKTLRNADDRNEVVGRVARVRPDSPRRWGKMTPHQMICHLCDSFRGPMGVKPLGIAPGFVLRGAIKWIALYAPLPWPKGLPTMAEMDQHKDGTPPAEFPNDVSELLRLTGRFTSELRDFAWRPHPIFLHMSDKDWMRWGYLHMDHHLRQFGQ